jgi:MoaD family protein
MPTVLVKHYVVIREATGVREEKLEFNGSTLKDLVNELSFRHGRKFWDLVVNVKTGELQRGIIVSVNGVDARSLGGLKAKIKEGDVVIFLPPIAGG